MANNSTEPSSTPFAGGEVDDRSHYRPPDHDEEGRQGYHQRDEEVHIIDARKMGAEGREARSEGQTGQDNEATGNEQYALGHQ